MAKNTRTMRLAARGKAITLPINPEDIKVKYGMDGKSKTLIGGEWYKPGVRKLRTTTISTWLPDTGDKRFAPSRWNIKTALDLLFYWMWNKIDVLVSITGMTNVRYYITDITTSCKEGDRSIYVDIDLTEVKKLKAR